MEGEDSSGQVIDIVKLTLIFYNMLSVWLRESEFLL